MFILVDSVIVGHSFFFMFILVDSVIVGHSFFHVYFT